jgi:NADPH-dependent 2,4-dienoyl-CoA reductase/sulfur reductase-like enzyme
VAGTPAAVEIHAGIVLVVAGVTPDTALARAAGADLGPRGAIRVDRRMATGLPDVFAAGDCVVTHHVLLGETYLPLGTTAHKQGRVAGEGALGGERRFAGSLGTQVVRVFDAVAARTGIRDHEARSAGLDPRTVAATPDDHKAYYPGATPIHLRLTGDLSTGRLLGVQMVGAVASAVHKRVDTAAAALFAGLSVDEVNDLDLAYTPPLGSPWDALQVAAQRWGAEAASRGANADRADAP